MTVTVDRLIYAIGRAEGLGVEKNTSGQYVFRRYDQGNQRYPFGLVGDTRNNPNLRTDAKYCFEFVKFVKITNPNSAVFVPGLVDSNGNINIDKLPLLANKWAPIGAENDPNNLNANWLPNVYHFLGVVGPDRPAPDATYKGVSVNYVIYYPVALDGKYGKRYIADSGGFCDPAYYKWYYQQFKKEVWHPGVDYNTATQDDDYGEPVYAMADGQVTFSGVAGTGWGNLLTIYHPQLQRTSVYGHLSSLTVAYGTQVQAGQLVGLMGDGSAPGVPKAWAAHLHFEVRIGDTLEPAFYPFGKTKAWVQSIYENPDTYLKRMGAREPGEPPIKGSLHPDLIRIRKEVKDHVQLAYQGVKLVTIREYESRRVTLERLKKAGVRVEKNFVSPHNTNPALAFDFQLVRTENGKQTTLPPNDPLYQKVGQEFTKKGVLWGGEMKEVQGERTKVYHVELKDARAALEQARDIGDITEDATPVSTKDTTAETPKDSASKGC